MNIHNITGIDVGEGLDATVVVISTGLAIFGGICCIVQFRKICC